MTLGAVLAEAGAHSGMHVAASQAYGSRARGGATRADVILSAEEIDFPHVIHPDLLVVLAQEAYDLYCQDIVRGGVLLGDDFFVKPTQSLEARQLTVPATRTALEGAKNKVAANFVMLGAVVGYTGIVGEESIAEAIRAQVNPRFLEVNLTALRLGLELGRTLTQTEGAWR